MIEFLSKLLNWFFNNFERRTGLHTGRKPPETGYRCPGCNGSGVLADSGDVCPSCSGRGRVDP